MQENGFREEKLWPGAVLLAGLCVMLALVLIPDWKGDRAFRAKYLADVAARNAAYDRANPRHVFGATDIPADPDATEEAAGCYPNFGVVDKARCAKAMAPKP